MPGGSFTLGRTKRLQDRISTLLGCSPDARPAVVTAMLHRSPAEKVAKRACSDWTCTPRCRLGEPPQLSVQSSGALR